MTIQQQSEFYAGWGTRAHINTGLAQGKNPERAWLLRTVAVLRADRDVRARGIRRQRRNMPLAVAITEPKVAPG